MLTLPLNTLLLPSSQITFPWGCLIITGRASILILIIIITINSILILRSLWRRRWRSNKATKAILSLCNTTNTCVYLIQLNSESIKMSIYALKLHHDYLKSHTTHRRRRSGGGRNGRGWRIRHLGRRPLRSKLGLASPNRRCTNGIYDSVERRMMRRIYMIAEGKMSLS